MAKVAKNTTRKGGRAKGTPNKKTIVVQETLDRLNCDPIEGMVLIAKAAKRDKDYALAGAMYKELAQYVAPKRKALEVTGANDTPLVDEISDSELARKIAFILSEAENGG